jgi:preprotein translocase subunit SecE
VRYANQEIITLQKTNIILLIEWKQVSSVVSAINTLFTENLNKEIIIMAIKEKKTETKSKLLELLVTDYKWENILLAIVSILGIILGLMIITGLGPLQISANFPILGTEPWGKIFAWTILAIALFGLFLVLYPFVVPALPEIKKITWPHGKDYWANVVRTVIFTAFITALIVFFDAIIKLIILKG